MINRCLHHSVRCKMDYKMLIRYKMENVGILQNRTCISCSNLEYFVILPDPTDSEQNYILKFQEEVWIAYWTILHEMSSSYWLWAKLHFKISGGVDSMLHTTEQSCTKCHHLRSIDAICNIFLLKEDQKCQYELNICQSTGLDCESTGPILRNIL